MREKHELIKVDPQEYGMESNKAKQISDMFKPMLEKMEELEARHNEIVKLEINRETCKAARELRLQLVKVRTGCAKIHRDAKSDIVKAGKFIDGWKNAQLACGEKLEANLDKIEKHFENIEKEKILRLQNERSEICLTYTESIIPNLGEMPDEVWINYLTGLKLNHQAKLDAEKREAEIRAAEAKKIAEEQARRDAEAKALRAENERLLAERVKKEEEAIAERKRLEAETLFQVKERDKAEQELRLANEKLAKVQQSDDLFSATPSIAPVGNNDKQRYEEFHNAITTVIETYKNCFVSARFKSTVASEIQILNSIVNPNELFK